jgi:UDP-N-acetylmuramoyl-tripeptide--D-alanyl-D-alanine ligase
MIAIVDRNLGEKFRTSIALARKAPPTQNPDFPLCLLVDNSLSGLQQTARFWRSQLSLKVIGITGSVGKSTTKELVAEVLSQRYLTAKNLGNLNNEIGLPLTILGLEESHQRAVLEMDFYVPGEIALLRYRQTGNWVVTNIGTVRRAGWLQQKSPRQSRAGASASAVPRRCGSLELRRSVGQADGRSDRSQDFLLRSRPAGRPVG